MGDTRLSAASGLDRTVMIVLLQEVIAWPR
jgi:hypothetical protein